MPVEGGGAEAQAGGDADGGDAAEGDGFRAEGQADAEVGEIVGELGAGAGADDELGAGAFHQRAAADGGIALDEGGEVVEIHAILVELRGIHGHHHLLVVAAGGVDFGDAGDGFQAGFDEEFVGELEAAEAGFGDIGGGVVFESQSVGEHFAEAGTGRGEAGGEAGGQFILRLGEPFGNHLPGLVQVGAVGKNEANLGDAEAGERADLFEMRGAEEFEFEGAGDGVFDFLGREVGNGGEHLHLNVADVRGDIEGQPAGGPDAEQQDDRGQRQGGGAIADGAFDDGAEQAGDIAFGWQVFRCG